MPVHYETAAVIRNGTEKVFSIITDQSCWDFYNEFDRRSRLNATWTSIAPLSLFFCKSFLLDIVLQKVLLNYDEDH